MINKKINTKTVVGVLALLLGSGLSALAGTDNRAPEVPFQIALDTTTNKIQFHGFGVGFQVYTWNGTDWGRAVPEATLFVGNAPLVDHFAGPTWESPSGSRVQGAVMSAVIVDTNAIPWLLLSAVPDKTQGPGIFADTTFIQRVNTTGGKAPFENGAFVGQVAKVPYTADYFFYRQSND